jgi:hypothetical protein
MAFPREKTMRPATILAALGLFAPLAATPAMAQPNASAFDAAVVATHPQLEAGKVTGIVVAAKTIGCNTTLTLESGQSFTLHLASRGVSMNKMLLIGDDDEAVGLTFQGDGARAAATAAEQALGPLSDACQG